MNTGDWLSFIEHQFVNGACPPVHFFVYALHAFSGINPIMIVGKMERVLHVDGSLIAYLITPFAVYALSVLLYCILNKYLPRITHIITGR